MEFAREDYALIPGASERTMRILRRYGPGALKLCADHGTQIVELRRNQAYSEASPALRRLAIDVDCWPSVPAGLFVVEERTVYLRSRSEMTISHEFGHALDCALGGGVYLSGIDPEFRELFNDARAFLTPYAATGADEMFAESVGRGWTESNDRHSFWPRATRERLKRIHPEIYAYAAALYARLDAPFIAKREEAKWQTTSPALAVTTSVSPT